MTCTLISRSRTGATNDVPLFTFERSVNAAVQSHNKNTQELYNDALTNNYKATNKSYTQSE